MTALGPAARQHGAAVAGAHPLAEAVRLGALAVIWLKRSLWHVCKRARIALPRALPRCDFEGEPPNTPV
jgi:hypothetical protein